MKVLYTRISTSINQKVDRQIVDKDQYDYVLMDTCSGSIPLYERPKGSEIEKLISWGKLKELHVHSIDRLGRNTIDVLSTWKELTEKGIRIICKNPSLQNIDENGKEDQFSSLLIGILSTLSQYEKSTIRERQMEGIRIRKEKGLYRREELIQEILQLNYSRNQSQRKYWITWIRVTPTKISPKSFPVVEPQ